MRPEDLEWLDQNRRILYVSIKMTKPELYKIYEIYNQLTDSHKKPNGCSSCLRQTINTIKSHYEKANNI